MGWLDGQRAGIDEVTRLDGQEGAIGMVTVYVEAKSAVSNASLTASSSALRRHFVTRQDQMPV